MSNQPPIGVPQGAIRLNTDSQKLEFFAQDRWYEMATDFPYLGKSTNSDITGGARGICGGMTPDASTAVTALDFITIPTAGAAQDFGNLSVARIGLQAYSSRTRGVFAGGLNKNEIDFVEIATTGTAIDFGNAQANRAYSKGLSNQTRGISGGGYPGTDQIDYITIASQGDAQDFGNLSSRFNTDTNNIGGGPAGAASPTRGVFSGGYINPGTLQSLNTLQYITIATTGDTQDFGDLTVSARAHSGQACSSTRSVVASGYNQPTNGNYYTVESTEYYTFATLGNAVSFGDMLATSGISPGGTSNSVRGVWMGGGDLALSPSYGTNVIQYVNIPTLGDTIDFGDMVTTGGWCDACSNAHGGL